MHSSIKDAAQTRTMSGHRSAMRVGVSILINNINCAEIYRISFYRLGLDINGAFKKPDADPTDKAHHTGNDPWKTRFAPFTKTAGDATGIAKTDDLQNPQTQIASPDDRGRNGPQKFNQPAYSTSNVQAQESDYWRGVTTTKIIMSEDHAVDVEFSETRRAKQWVVHPSKEVILSAGTIGIGPKDEHKIVHVDLPGVGQNLTDIFNILRNEQRLGVHQP
jgi:choline dehydrogenase-like flavoprotein